MKTEEIRRPKENMIPGCCYVKRTVIFKDAKKRLRHLSEVVLRTVKRSLAASFAIFELKKWRSVFKNTTPSLKPGFYLKKLRIFV